MTTSPRVVIIGAGIVGANLADELLGCGWDDITVEQRNEITIVGYCRCGHWFKCRDEADRRTQMAWHHTCTYRNRIEWHATPQLQLF